MRVFLEVVPHNLSVAMHRVAQALRVRAPKGVQIVRTPQDVDLQVLHAIGPDAIENVVAPRVAVIQYCLHTAHGPASWTTLWRRAELTWSYFDLRDLLPAGARFYLAPLGVDPVFRGNGAARYVGVVTSGYDSGPQAEAIEEVADAALRAELSVYHVGPEEVAGMAPRHERTWQSGQSIADEDLARIYGCARWVSGLRRVEGFELPVIEGLACGARPIVFDRPDMRRWYEGHAVFVPECAGPELVERLVAVFDALPEPVSLGERRAVLAKFDWGVIAGEFWRQVLER